MVLVCFDACYMAAAEVALEYSGLVRLIVGSQVTLPFNGWPYDSVLRFLRSHPRVKPESLAKAIDRAVILSYPATRTVTQSALRPDGADAVARAAPRSVWRMNRDDRCDTAMSSACRAGLTLRGDRRPRWPPTLTNPKEVADARLQNWKPRGMADGSR